MLCPTLCDPMDCSLPGSSVYGILQARILEWIAISFSRGSSQPRDRTQVSCVSCIGRQILYHWAARGRPFKAVQMKAKTNEEGGISSKEWEAGSRDSGALYFTEAFLSRSADLTTLNEHSFLLTDSFPIAVAWLQSHKSRIHKIKGSVELINANHLQ